MGEESPTPGEALANFREKSINGNRLQPININRNIKKEKEVLRVYKGNLYLFKKPVVYFMSFDEEGEEGSDVGGPTKEFFQIVHDSILSGTCPPFPLFEGARDHLLPIHNQSLLSMGMYKTVGKAMAHSILHNGPAYEGLANPVKTYLVTQSVDNACDNIDIDDCPYLDIVQLLRSIYDATETQVEELNANPIVADMLFSCGCSMAMLNMTNKHLAVTEVLKHHVVLRRKQELDDIIDGLNSIGLQTFLSKHPLSVDLLFPTVDQVKILYVFLRDHIKLASPVNEEMQQNAFVYFLDYLENACSRSDGGE